MRLDGELDTGCSSCRVPSSLLVMNRVWVWGCWPATVPRLVSGKVSIGCMVTLLGPALVAGLTWSWASCVKTWLAHTWGLFDVAITWAVDRRPGGADWAVRAFWGPLWWIRVCRWLLLLLSARKMSLCNKYHWACLFNHQVSYNEVKYTFFSVQRGSNPVYGNNFSIHKWQIPSSQNGFRFLFLSLILVYYYFEDSFQVAQEYIYMVLLKPWIEMELFSKYIMGSILMVQIIM